MAILLVEDDSTLSRNIKEALVDEGFSVEVVYDGVVAEKLMRRSTYECIILDINLPGKSGYELCTNFRKTNEDTPIIFLTAFADLEDKIEGFQMGADDYLTKPFFMKELLVRIKALLKRRSSLTKEPLSKEIKIDDLTIDIGNKLVKRAGIIIDLTPREYQILVKLVQKNGELVSKEELIKEIWGTSLDVNTNTIEVYINFLRRKVDKPFGKESIKTKIGFGYYFSE